MDAIMTNKRKTLVLIIALIMSLFLSACTVSEKDKSAIFKCMKKENLIQVNDMDFDDYSDSENVSNAPVPGYTEYYTYENGNTSYRICFEGYYVEGEGKKYTAFVRETNGNEETSQKYYFAKTKILKRMKKKSVLIFKARVKILKKCIEETTLHWRCNHMEA